MTYEKPNVMIKGTKDGFVFELDDDCTYQTLMDELKNKLYTYNPHLLEGQYVHASIKLGYRYLTSEQKEELKQVIRSYGNLIVDGFDSEVVTKEEAENTRKQSNIEIIHRTVRSGQVISSEGHILVLGDINPGGCVQANGNIYIMGALRGMAHAGFSGKTEAIIAASILRPTQMRIAHIVSRQPDEWVKQEHEKEFAYTKMGHIVVEKLQNLAEVRPKIDHMIQAY